MSFTFITLLDFIGTFAFAISGIRLASEKNFYCRNGHSLRRRYYTRYFPWRKPILDDPLAVSGYYSIRISRIHV